MARFTPEQLQEKFNTLPNDLRNAVVSLPANDLLYDIAVEHNLEAEHITALANEVGYVILELTPAREFVTHVGNVLKVTPEVQTAIVAEINEKIFGALREKMKQVHGEEHMHPRMVGINTPAPQPEAPVAPTPVSAPTPAPAPMTPPVQAPSMTATPESRPMTTESTTPDASVAPAPSQSSAPAPTPQLQTPPQPETPTAPVAPVAPTMPPQPETPSPTSIYEQKMNAPVSSPEIERKVVEVDANAPPAVDPYREPIT